MIFQSQFFSYGARRKPVQVTGTDAGKRVPNKEPDKTFIQILIMRHVDKVMA